MSEFKNKKQLRSHKVVVALNDDKRYLSTIIVIKTI